MAVGGFNGTDPSPTLEQFQQLVADGQVHWFVGGRRAGRDGQRRQRRVPADRRVGRRRPTPRRPSTASPSTTSPGGVVTALTPGRDGRTAGAQIDHNDRTARRRQRRPHERRHRAAPAPPTRTDRARRARRRRPRLQRGDRPRAVGPAAARPPDRAVPVLVPDHDRGQREHRRDARRSRARLAGGAARRRRRCGWSRRAAGGRCATAWSASDAQVLAYCDVDLSTDLAALLPLVAPLISGHSDLAIGTRLGRGSRVVRGRQAGVHLALLQPAAARDAGRRVLRRAVRLQGDPRRRRAAGCCRWSRTPAGSSTPSCWCSPSAPGCASTRCRSTGSTTRTAASTSSRPRWPTCGASCGSGGRWPPGALPLAELRRQLGRDALPTRPWPGVPHGLPRQLVRFAAIGVVSTVGLPRAVRAAARGGGRVRGQPARAASSPPWPTPRPTGG